jgi:hypothetical protein
MTTRFYVSGVPVDVRDPDGWELEQSTTLTGAAWRTLDGSLRAQGLPIKRRWALAWTGLRAAELATLRAELERSGVLQFQPPDGATTYSVLLIGDIVVNSDGYSASVSCTLEQV